MHPLSNVLTAIMLTMFVLSCFRHSLLTEAGKYFDKDTGVLQAPMVIRVADQVGTTLLKTSVE